MKKLLKRIWHGAVGVLLIVGLSSNGLAKDSQSAVPIAQHLQVQMVDSGYTMGDKIAMQATFELGKGEEIDPDSVPLAGRVRPWLDITEVDLAQSGQMVNLKVVWQLFATVEIAQQLSMPPIVLKTIGKHTHSLQIPPQTFYYSPVLPLPPLKDIKRRASQPPPAFDTTTPVIKLIICAVLLSVLALVWAWMRDALPWQPFRPGPMTQLARALKSPAHQNTTLDQIQLKQIHQALNASAGESLYIDDLNPLINNAPYFSSVQSQVSAFVQASWQHFYAPTKAEPIQANSVYAWVKEVACAERIYRKQLAK